MQICIATESSPSFVDPAILLLTFGYKTVAADLWPLRESHVQLHDLVPDLPWQGVGSGDCFHPKNRVGRIYIGNCSLRYHRWAVVLVRATGEVAGSWLLLMLGALFKNRPGMQRENSKVLPPDRRQRDVISGARRLSKMCIIYEA